MSFFLSSSKLSQWYLPRLSWKSEPDWTRSMWRGIPHPITQWSLATSCPVEMEKGQHRPTPSGSVRRPGITSSLGSVSYWLGPLQMQRAFKCTTLHLATFHQILSQMMLHFAGEKHQPCSIRSNSVVFHSNTALLLLKNKEQKKHLWRKVMINISAFPSNAPMQVVIRGFLVTHAARKWINCIYLWCVFVLVFFPRSLTVCVCVCQSLTGSTRWGSGPSTSR